MPTLVDHGAIVDDETILSGEVVELRARIGVSNRYLDGLNIESFSKVDGVADRLLGFTGKAEDEVAMNGKAKLMAKSRARSTVAPFLMFLRICGSPDSKPTISRRQPASRIALRVSRSVVTREVQDQVSLSGLSFSQSSTVRTFWMLKVSSSKKNSFTSGKSSLACAISAATSSVERLRQACPLRVCGHRQKVHCAGQPRVEYRET